MKKSVHVIFTIGILLMVFASSGGAIPMAASGDLSEHFTTTSPHGAPAPSIVGIEQHDCFAEVKLSDGTSVATRQPGEITSGTTITGNVGQAAVGFAPLDDDTILPGLKPDAECAGVSIDMLIELMDVELVAIETQSFLEGRAPVCEQVPVYEVLLICADPTNTDRPLYFVLSCGITSCGVAGIGFLTEDQYLALRRNVITDEGSEEDEGVVPLPPVLTENLDATVAVVLDIKPVCLEIENPPHGIYGYGCDYRVELQRDKTHNVYSSNAWAYGRSQNWYTEMFRVRTTQDYDNGHGNIVNFSPKSTIREGSCITGTLSATYNGVGAEVSAVFCPEKLDPYFTRGKELSVTWEYLAGVSNQARAAESLAMVRTPNDKVSGLWFGYSIWYYYNPGCC